MITQVKLNKTHIKLWLRWNCYSILHPSILCEIQSHLNQTLQIVYRNRFYWDSIELVFLTFRTLTDQNLSKFPFIFISLAYTHKKQSNDIKPIKNFRIFRFSSASTLGNYSYILLSSINPQKNSLTISNLIILLLN